MRPVPAEAVLGAFRLKTPKSAAQGRKPATIPCLRAGLKPVPKARIEFSAARKVMPQEEIEMEVIEKKECNPSHPSRKDKNAARVGHPGGAPSAQVGHPAPRWGTQHPGGAPSTQVGHPAPRWGTQHPGGAPSTQMGHPAPRWGTQFIRPLGRLCRGETDTFRSLNCVLQEALRLDESEVLIFLPQKPQKCVFCDC